MPSGERQQLVRPIKSLEVTITKRVGLIASQLSSNVIKKTDCMNITVSFEDLFDVSVVVL